MSLADGDLIDTDGPRRRQPRPLDLLLHVELIQVLHRSVVQTFHLGHRLVRHIPAQLAHMRRKALGVARVVRQPVQVFYMHTTAPTTVDAPTLVFQIDPVPSIYSSARTELAKLLIYGLFRKIRVLAQDGDHHRRQTRKMDPP